MIPARFSGGHERCYRSRARAWFVALVLVAGCRYGIGGRLPTSVRSVSIPPALVEERELPTSFDVEPILTEAVRDAFVRGNVLALVPGRRGDSRVDLTLLTYEWVEDAAGKTLWVEVGYAFSDSRSGAALVPDGRIRRDIPVDLESGTDDAEQKAFTALAREIAAEVYARTVQGW